VEEETQLASLCAVTKEASPIVGVGVTDSLRFVTGLDGGTRKPLDPKKDSVVASAGIAAPWLDADTDTAERGRLTAEVGGCGND
jgi:hypothetical protein